MSNSRIVGNLNGNFTIIRNDCLEDSNISWKAKGLLVYMASKPENWQFWISKIVKDGTDGKASVQKGLNELIEHGYIKRIEKRAEKGRFNGYDYAISDNKSFEHLTKEELESFNRNTISPLPKNGDGKTVTENQPLNNTNLNNTNLNNTNNIYIEKEKLINRELKTDITEYQYYQKIKGMIKNLSLKEVEVLVHNINHKSYGFERFNSYDKSMEIVNFIDRKEYLTKYIPIENDNIDIPF